MSNWQVRDFVVTLMAEVEAGPSQQTQTETPGPDEETQAPAPSRTQDCEMTYSCRLRGAVVAI